MGDYPTVKATEKWSNRHVSRSVNALSQTCSFAFFRAWDHPIPGRGGSREAQGQIPSSGCGCRCKYQIKIIWYTWHWHMIHYSSSLALFRRLPTYTWTSYKKCWRCLLVLTFHSQQFGERFIELGIQWKRYEPNCHSIVVLTFLQITPVAAERSAQKRLEYIARIGKYNPEHLVFVDESSVDRRTTYRNRAWSIRGTKAQRKAFFVRGRR